MKLKNLLIILGIYLILDGIISFLYFQETATWFEQMPRIIRVFIGIVMGMVGCDK